MHFTPRPRWLMIASTAIAVFPVLRSPMMSWRWPRPMGVIASIDLMPVCMGSCTGLRPMIPGAWISTRRAIPPTMSPRPSTGSPSALTTRPSNASPTGTLRIRPVALTVWPSSTPSASPRTTAPIDSSSRFRARPTVPSSNSSNSLTAQSGRPLTRAMPSPTSVTRPTVRASSDGSKPSRFFFSAAAMSPALRVSSAMVLFCLRVVSDALEAGLQLLDSGADGAIDHGVADRGDEAAQYGWIDDDFEVDLFAGGIGQRSGQASLLVRGQRNRRSDFGNLEVLGRRGPGDQLV